MNRQRTSNEQATNKQRTGNELIYKYENPFLKREIDYLTNFQHESSNFYGLPIIHKSKISKAIKGQCSEYISCFQPKDIKLRPRVADHKCPTKRLRNLSIFFSNLFVQN